MAGSRVQDGARQAGGRSTTRAISGGFVPRTTRTRGVFDETRGLKARFSATLPAYVRAREI